jgi:hypothetical protein
VKLLSPRLLIPLALIVLAWGGVHLFGSHNVEVAPAAWPMAQPTPSPAPSPVMVTAAPAPASSPEAAAIPVLPEAMRQLNGSTRDAAIGLYALIQQLEGALRSHMEQLVKQLEPGR